MEPTLVNVLIKKQEELNLTNEQFAGLLGVTRASWEWALKGRFNPGANFLAGIVQTFLSDLAIGSGTGSKASSRYGEGLELALAGRWEPPQAPSWPYKLGRSLQAL